MSVSGIKMFIVLYVGQAPMLATEYLPDCCIRVTVLLKYLYLDVYVAETIITPDVCQANRAVWKSFNSFRQSFNIW